MKLIIIGSLAYLASITLLFSQPLARKGQFGATFNVLETGIAINSITPGYTAAKLKLQSGDIIHAVNSRPILNKTDFANAWGNLRANQKVSVTVVRNNKKQTFTANVIAKDYEKSKYGPVIYEQAAYKNGQLRVIINKPYGDTIFPAVLFIPGYTCSSIDNLFEEHPYKRIVDSYQKAGFVVLRIEKSGLGDSYNTPNCEDCDLFDEIENFEAGLLHLKKLKYVDTSNIIIYGHSMGGIIAPALAAKHKVKGVAVYGTTAKSWFEYQIEMYRTQFLLDQMDPIKYEYSIRAQYEICYRFFILKDSVSKIAENPKLDSLLRHTWEYNGKNKIFSRNAMYWQQIQDMPHLENWKNAATYVLVQFGESDFQAFSKADHEQIVNTVNYYHPGKATLQTFANTDHYFAKSGSMADAYLKFKEKKYQQLFKEYNFEVDSALSDWSKKIIQTRQ